jgi:hypothetical protein
MQLSNDVATAIVTNAVQTYRTQRAIADAPYVDRGRHEENVRIADNLGNLLWLVDHLGINVAGYIDIPKPVLP